MLALFLLLFVELAKRRIESCFCIKQNVWSFCFSSSRSISIFLSPASIFNSCLKEPTQHCQYLLICLPFLKPYWSGIWIWVCLALGSLAVQSLAANLFQPASCGSWPITDWTLSSLNCFCFCTLHESTERRHYCCTKSFKLIIETLKVLNKNVLTIILL